MKPMIVDPVESLRGEAMRRIVDNNIFLIDQIQKENSIAPDSLPYCRITIPQADEVIFRSQRIMQKTVIVEFDILTSAMTQTQLAGQLASKIEDVFGLYDRDPLKKKIILPGWSGVEADVERYGRGTATVEQDVNLFYLPVLIYVRLTIFSNAKFEV